MSAKKIRFLEIDAWRGLAIVSMVIFHLFYGLDFFDIRSYDLFDGAWAVFGNFIRWSFLLLVGIGMQLSYQRHLYKGKTKHDFLFNNLKRGLVVVLCGGLISLFTYIYIPQSFVRIGILHLIGTSIIVLAGLVNWPKIAAAFGVGIIFLEPLVTSLHSSNRFLSVFGIYDKTFSSLDYFPLFPWMAYPALGIFLGSLLFANYKRRYPSPERFFNNILGRFLAACGKKSLMIYMVHIPILLLLISLILKMN